MPHSPSMLNALILASGGWSLATMAKTSNRKPISLPDKLVHLRHARDARSCSIHRAGCLGGPNLVLKAWRITGELLVLSLSWKPEEAASNTSKGETQDRWTWQPE